MFEQNFKSHPGLAAVFSFIFNGLGQLYNGQIFKGLIIIFFSAISVLVLIISSVFIGLWLLGKVTSGAILIWGIALFLISLVSICIIGIYSIFDAYRAAKKINA
jgi:TM2 domain-containing membrane protein YozV